MGHKSINISSKFVKRFVCQSVRLSVCPSRFVCPRGQTFLLNRRRGTNIFTHRRWGGDLFYTRGCQTFNVGGGGGNNDVDVEVNEEMDVSEANFLVSGANILFSGANILVSGANILVSETNILVCKARGMAYPNTNKICKIYQTLLY